jgi:hypothetical protein
LADTDKMNTDPGQADAYWIFNAHGKLRNIPNGHEFIMTQKRKRKESIVVSTTYISTNFSLFQLKVLLFFHS